ncbi:hypothetical protein ACUOAQ_26010 [Escherichia sp. SP-MK]
MLAVVPGVMGIAAFSPPLLPGKPTRYAHSPERPYSPSIIISARMYGTLSA